MFALKYVSTVPKGNVEFVYNENYGKPRLMCYLKFTSCRVVCYY